jgi:four helix bundle protein
MGLAARIAEGCGRDNNVEFAVELRRAKASASELEYFFFCPTISDICRMRVISG